jgi:hypothetical protein
MDYNAQWVPWLDCRHDGCEQSEDADGGIKPAMASLALLTEVLRRILIFPRASLDCFFVIRSLLNSVFTSIVKQYHAAYLSKTTFVALKYMYYFINI